MRVAVREPAGAEDEVVKAMTRAQLARLLDELDDHWRLFFEFLTHTGLRISEAIEVRWGSDLDLGERSTLKLRRQFTGGEVSAPKSAAGRRNLPLSAGMVERLRALEGPPGRLVFTTATGRQINRSNLWRDVLHPAAERAGLPWVSFHNFRHTCASLLFASGKNVKQVQVWLGHADPGFTVRTYIHLMDDGLGDADFLDDVTGDGSSGE